MAGPSVFISMSRMVEMFGSESKRPISLSEVEAMETLRFVRIVVRGSR